MAQKISLGVFVSKIILKCQTQKKHVNALAGGGRGIPTKEDETRKVKIVQCP